LVRLADITPLTGHTRATLALPSVEVTSMIQCTHWITVTWLTPLKQNINIKV